MTQPKVWIIGNRGMLGTELSELFASRGISVTGTDREVDITDQEMKAWLYVTPPGPNGADLSVDVIVAFLKNNRVLAGIDETRQRDLTQVAQVHALHVRVAGGVEDAVRFQRVLLGGGQISASVGSVAQVGQDLSGHPHVVALPGDGQP